MQRFTHKVSRRMWRVVLLTLIFATANLGGSEAQFRVADRELQLSGGFTHQQGTDTGTVNGDVSYGVFFTPNWELGFRQGLSYSFIDGADDAWQASTIPFFNYHFTLQNNPKFVPFIGGFVGALWNDDDISGTIGPNVGIKYFLNDTTFIVTRYRFEWAINEFDAGGVTDEASDGNHIVTIGFGMRFGG